MDIILIADSLESTQPLLRVAASSDYRVLKLIESNDDVSQYIATLCPDVLIFISDEVDRPLLKQIRAAMKIRPTPIIIFTRDSLTESINAAVQAGASTYVVDCHEAERLPSLIGVAQARFSEQQRVTKELQQTKNALNERKNIEKAKGIIMQTKNLSEDQAYGALRKLAMNHNKRIGEISEQIISAAEILV